MARRALSLTLSVTAAAVLVGSLAVGADTPKASPSPKPTPSPRPRSLGEVARKKAAGTSTKAASPSPEPSPGRVFTNEDLPAQPSPAAIASPGAAGTGRGTVNTSPETAGAHPPAGAPNSEDTSLAEEEAGWRARGASLREAIAAAEKSIPEIEDRLAAVRNDRSPTNLMDPNREQTRQAEMAKLQAELDSVRAGLERSRQAQTDLEEEARRKGIPPGWLR